MVNEDVKLLTEEKKIEHFRKTEAQLQEILILYQDNVSLLKKRRKEAKKVKESLITNIEIAEFESLIKPLERLISVYKVFLHQK